MKEIKNYKAWYKIDHHTTIRRLDKNQSLVEYIVNAETNLIPEDIANKHAIKYALHIKLPDNQERSYFTQTFLDLQEKWKTKPELIDEQNS